MLEKLLKLIMINPLVKMARRAQATKKESDYKRLGKKIFEYLSIQDSNSPEYVNPQRKRTKTKKESNTYPPQHSSNIS